MEKLIVNTYTFVAILVGLTVFVAVWLYAISSWGFLIGISLGWLPATIAAYIIGIFWPFFLIIALFLFKSLNL